MRVKQDHKLTIIQMVYLSTDAAYNDERTKTETVIYETEFSPLFSIYQAMYGREGVVSMRIDLWIEDDEDGDRWLQIISTEGGNHD